MILGILRITRKLEDGPCGKCEETIFTNEPHALISQKMGRSKKGNYIFKNYHLHIFCMGAWMIIQMVNKGLRPRKKGGRPVGSGGLSLSLVDRKRRLALLKMRSRILSSVESESNEDTLVSLHQRFIGVTREIDALGGPAKINIRTILDLKTIESKLMEVRRRTGWKSS